MSTESGLNYLAFESGVLTPRFQAWHLAINYSILALACALYLLGAVGTWGIILGCVPGVVVFIISLEALAWKMAVEGGDVFGAFTGFIR